MGHVGYESVVVEQVVKVQLVEAVQHSVDEEVDLAELVVRLQIRVYIEIIILGGLFKKKSSLYYLFYKQHLATQNLQNRLYVLQI